MNGIIWLASYPKSGNTWIRAVLTSLLQHGGGPVDLNDLVGGPTASARKEFEDEIGIDSSDLTNDECDLLRRDFYAKLGQSSGELIFKKIHDAYSILPDGKAMIPKTGAAGVIYLVRNPLDIAVSFAEHSNTDDVDFVIATMANPEQILSKGNHSKPGPLMREKLLGWSNHVLGWTTQTNIPVVVARYEDMVLNPFKTMSTTLNHFGDLFDSAIMKRAIENTSFSKLQKAEDDQGFRERRYADVTFFRKGKILSCLNTLSEDQVKAIITAHKSTMQRIGYETDFELIKRGIILKQTDPSDTL